ncbi:DUF3566 domain-containing protein [Terrabacter sp. 2RAF25]|uniref:DUF3566 domain-containing protein n=1 Tax=Terrabacter sp. 2RAF25 TaxID=3232998 RepID=UPI003F9C942E
MSTTSSEGSFGAAGYGAGTSRGSGSGKGATSGGGSGSASPASGTGSADSGSGSSSGSSNGYYGSGGAAYSSGSGPGSSGSTSGASPSDSTTSLSRGAVTTRTAPTQKVGAAPGRPAGAPGSAPRKHKGPRRVRLAVARVDPWSVMKMSFLLSVALGIAGVILTAVLWMILSTMNVFSDIEGVLQSLQTTTSDPFSIKDYVGFGRVVSLSIVIGVIDVILMTAIATVMAFLYNICSALVGGVQLTLTDD